MRSRATSTGSSPGLYLDEGGPTVRRAEDPVRHRLREFLFGVTGYEFAREAAEMRAALETIFMVVTVGDMVGLPVMPPYYSLRLLPYVVPQTATWRRRVLRDRHYTEEHEFDLHGV
jgi:hypothetical protein